MPSRCLNVSLNDTMNIDAPLRGMGRVGDDKVCCHKTAGPIKAPENPADAAPLWRGLLASGVINKVGRLSGLVVN